jgi:hypothetical protein
MEGISVSAGSNVALLRTRLPDLWDVAGSDVGGSAVETAASHNHSWIARLADH